MQNPTQEFRQGSTVFEKPGILSKKLSSNYHSVKFCRNFAHVSYLPMCSKGFLRVVSFCLDLPLFAKIKRPDFYTLTETRFIKHNKKP